MSNFASVAFPPGRQGTCLPKFQAKGTVMQKSHHFLTHNNAISGFTRQSLSLPAYACKTDSSTVIKLAFRMAPNLAILSSKIETKSGRKHSHLSTPLPRWGAGHPLLTLHPLGAFGALRRLVPRARHDSPLLCLLGMKCYPQQSAFLQLIIRSMHGNDGI